jgi:biotin-dependent carboxylase-like uncharacterized protein
MSGFEVIKSGILTLLQDKGRFSYTHLGVTNSGAMDEYAFLVGQKLLENDLNTNSLEIAFSNVELKSKCNTTVAITGASCEFFINDILKLTWQTHLIRKNDVIKIGKITSGQRVYLSIKNGFNIKEEFKSNSTTLKEGIGGLNGNKIKNGDFLEFDSFDNILYRRLKKRYIPKYEQTLTLRVVLSYQESSFSKEEKDKFFNSTYLITPDFNRMACKLSGEKISSSFDGIISEGIAYGSIQIPKDGQPIILLKERQTIGGYPKIGTVLDIDCFKLAQMKIGSYVKFEIISIEEAQKKTKGFYSIFS